MKKVVIFCACLSVGACVTSNKAIRDRASAEPVPAQSPQEVREVTNDAVLQAVIEVRAEITGVKNTVHGDQNDRYISWILASGIILIQLVQIFGNRSVAYKRLKYGRHFRQDTVRP